LCQTRGFNGFSFRDLADEVGIRSASIHHHFPTKSDLGQALVMRYRQRMETALSEISRREPDSSGRVKRFVNMLRELLRDKNRMCLCGILAAEAGTLAPTVTDEVRRFFDECEAWLTDVLKTGRNAKELAFSGSPQLAARAVFAALEGAMMSARAFNDERRLSDSADWVLSQLVMR
jgi:TetR/AcrR family transcriptional repressor of nem operon